MRRWEFILALGGAAAWPLMAHSQQSERMRRVGVLMNFDESDPDVRRRVTAFEQEMTKLGWRKGIDLEMNYRWTDGDTRKLQPLAAELERSKPDVILVNGSRELSSVAQETRSIPIVFVNVADPVASGLLASLAKPNGNATGFTNFEFAMGGKWVELLKELSPDLARVGMLINQGNVAPQASRGPPRRRLSRLGCKQ